MTQDPWYYSIFTGETRADIFDLLGPDAFKLTAGQIVDALNPAGYTPDVPDPSREMLPTPGVTTTVRQEERTFLVSVDEAQGTISVQEVTAEAYMDE